MVGGIRGERIANTIEIRHSSPKKYPTDKHYNIHDIPERLGQFGGKFYYCQVILLATIDYIQTIVNFVM